MYFAMPSTLIVASGQPSHESIGHKGTSLTATQSVSTVQDWS
jgi:hypothetical protein